jgi:SAM-dependent methyltransferase
MRTQDVNTAPPILDEESEAARRFYTGTDEQPPTYDYGLTAYAAFVSDVIASTQAGSVLEFGCNAGRNLDVIRRKLPQATLSGMDLNPKMIDIGIKKYGLDLRVCDENGLAGLPAASQDVVFTVSVVDHILYPEYTLRQLLRIPRQNLVLFEISSHRTGKAVDVIMNDENASTQAKSYPFSYLHDYRGECKCKFGTLCVADIQYQIQAGDMSALYRMFVFTPRRELLDHQLVTSLSLKPLGNPQAQN